MNRKKKSSVRLLSAITDKRKGRPKLDKDAPQEVKRLRMLQFESFDLAKKASERIQQVASECDCVNVVIREEGNMDDPELLGLAKQVRVFAGDAWFLIHERRQEEGWYKKLGS